MARVLVIEDDKQLGKTLKSQLEESGNQVVWCQSQFEYTKHKEQLYDIAVVDLNLPDGSGFDIVKTLQIPVIIMTALNSPENRLQGLELGVFDFIPKPFLFKEMMLKIERLLQQQIQIIDLSTGVKLDLKSRTIEDSSGDLTFLNDREFKILKLLIGKSPTVLSRDDILNFLNEDEGASHRSIDNIIVKLRQILKDEHHKYINSVRGIGYQWVGEKK